MPLMVLLKRRPHEGFGLYFKLLLTIEILFTWAILPIRKMGLICYPAYTLSLLLVLALLFYKFKAASEHRLCTIMAIIMVPFALYNSPTASIFGVIAGRFSLEA